MGKSIKEQLKEAKLPEHSLTVCLRGDLVATIEALEAELDRQRDKENEAGTKRMAGKSRSVQLAEQINEHRAAMAEAEVTFRLRAMPKARWREVKRDHPPAEDNREDQNLGVALFGIATAVLPQVTIEPEMDDDDWRQLEQVVSSGDWKRLAVAAVWLHEMGVDIPKSALASLVLQRRDADSR